jgi:DNA-directed RNA polymerase specialized sigma24 family protein
LRRECLNHCLRRLPAENRELIVEYYRKDGRLKNDHRAAMAERLGITLNALWSRAQRIRENLERCVMRRLKDHIS